MLWYSNGASHDQQALQVQRLRDGRPVAVKVQRPDIRAQVLDDLEHVLMLAADIVRSAIAPTWNDIGQLAAIAAIRTFLNYFLERDLAAEAGPG